MASRKPTRKDVAELANVSEATVSYVFNGNSKRVSEGTVQLVLQAAQKLDYRPDLIARSLKTGKTSVIGLTIPIISSPMLSVLANNVHEALFRHGYMVNVINTHEQTNLEEQALELLNLQSVDGLIACPVTQRAPHILRKFRDRGAPVVFMDRFAANFEADTVVSNNASSGKLATQYLINQGCARILCISFSRQASSAVERVKGYRKALDEAGIPFHERDVLHIEDPTGDRVEDMFLAHVDAQGMPDGVLATSQEIGMGVLKACRRRNIRYPSDRIVVFDAEWAQLIEPPLPVIRQNAKLMAAETVEQLIRRLDGSTEPYRTVSIEAELITAAG
jgi:LacI family transcriptional regulator